MQEASWGRGASPSVLAQGGWRPKEAQCFSSYQETRLGLGEFPFPGYLSTRRAIP